MFLGHFTHSLDDKGRVSIPATFRKVAQASDASCLILTRSDDPCLIAFTMEAWRAIIEKIQQQPMMSPEVKAFERLFVGNAFETTIDRQGRILLPPKLREYAGIEGQAVFVGRLGKFEVWEPARWREAELQSSTTLSAATGLAAIV